MNRNDDKFYRISLIVCLMIILGQSIYMFMYIKMNKTPDMNTDESGAKTLVDNMSFLRPFELRSENCILSPEIKIMDENGNVWLFKDLLETKKAALIYRFSETHCDLCINQHFMILKELSSKTNFEDLILLGAYTNTKKIKILRETYNLKFSIYNIMDDIGIPLEETNNPYFFIIDRDLRCYGFFSAIKENPQLTITCLENLIGILK